MTNSITDQLLTSNLALLIILGVVFTIKVVLFFLVEGGWDPLRIFYFSKIDLKMTTTQGLRSKRKFQNNLTRLFVTLLLLLFLSASFRELID